MRLDAIRGPAPAKPSSPDSGFAAGEPPSFSYGERILSYQSDVEVTADALLIVTETIRVRSEGNQIRRGITRDFPTRYRQGARTVRLAADESERKKLWAARKGAFGAMGRISPDFMLQDAVVPRSRLPEVLADTYRVGAKYRLRVANVFHAGDGNLHPYICFDARNADEVTRVKEAGREIMETCVRAGGTITGEHGTGLDKSDYLPLVFSPETLRAMLEVRAAFDPTGLCNPGKVIPAPRGCGEARAVASRIDERAQTDASSSHVHPARAGVARDGRAARRSTRGSESPAGERLLRASRLFRAGHDGGSARSLRLAGSSGWPVVPAGGETWTDAGNPLACAGRVVVKTARLSGVVEHEPADLVATARAGTTLAHFNSALSLASQCLPLDPPDDGRATLGGVAATGTGGAQSLAYAPPRSHVLGMTVALADARIIHVGGRVVKNVAGYDLCKLFVGSHGTLG